MTVRIALVTLGMVLIAGTGVAQDKSKLEAPAGGGVTPFGTMEPVPLEELGSLQVLVIDAESGEPVVDAEVQLLGTDRPAGQTNSKGITTFADCDYAHATLRIKKTGYIDALVHHPPREKVDKPKTIVQLHKKADEQAIFKEAHGEALDLAKGTVFVRFEPVKNDEIVDKVTCSLDAPGATAWTYDNKDKLSKGGTLAKNASERTVIFPNVKPGAYGLKVEPTKGWDCKCSMAAVEAGVYTVVHCPCAPATGEGD